MIDAFTPAMFHAMRRVNDGNVTAGDIGANPTTLRALCERGFLKAERVTSQTFYEPTAMGWGAIAVLSSPVLPRPSEGMISRIKRTVADHYNIPDQEMTSARRSRIVARPRQVAMYLARELTPKSLPDIGRLFGGRDHTTVIHAIRQIERLRATDSDFNAEVAALREKLETTHNQPTADASGVRIAA